jgi:phenylalanine-4-hydroxylase
VAKESKYISKKPDDRGFVNYSQEENDTWGILYKRQIAILENRACDEYIEGLKTLSMTTDSIPQIPDINHAMASITGWGVAPVPALIGFEKFFKLLANKKFPAATFIRTLDELDYLQEPDIFHEIFGHCPMLTNKAYAHFSQKYGEFALTCTPKERVKLAKIYWFTIEFGLLKTEEGLRIYGGGILSSIAETPYSLESNKAEHREFNIIDILRTPYRIDILQPIYYVLDSLDDLYSVFDLDLKKSIVQASELGMFAPLFTPKDKT